VVVIGGLVALILTSPGWSKEGGVRDTFFSWTAFKDSFPDVLRHFWLDVRVFMLAEVAVLAIGLLVALVRTSRSPALFPLRILATAFVDVFRGIPTILLVYLIGFGVPALYLTSSPPSLVFLGGVALTLSYGAYVAEVYRSGINSVHRSQRDAALAIGLTEGQALRFVILPQAVRRVAAPLLNDFVALQKDVGLISVLGAVDAIRAAQIEAARTFNFTPYVVAGLLFVLLAIPTGRIADAAAARATRRQEGG
jgi:polar amino acid transport system permease protein